MKKLFLATAVALSAGLVVLRQRRLAAERAAAAWAAHTDRID